MDLYNEQDFVRSLIISHATKPQNIIKPNDKILLKKNVYIEKTTTDSCTDDITIVLEINNNKILNANFYGIGCSISTATTDMILNNIKNKDIKNAAKLINDYLEMTQNGNVNSENNMNDLIIYKNVYKQANRILCAQTSAISIKKILQKIGYENENN